MLSAASAAMIASFDLMVMDVLLMRIAKYDRSY